MIEVDLNIKPWNGDSLADRFTEDQCSSKKDKIDSLIKIVKSLPINGCITGSCFLDGFDPDGWGTTPDVDVFVYSEMDLMKAVTIAQYGLKMEPGKGTDRTHKQETWKLERLTSNGLNYKFGITTYTFFYDEVMLNITYKQSKVNGRWMPLVNVPDVLSSFDMSIVMQGYDIKTKVFYDMRIGDPRVATPNPLRNHDCIMWNVAKWIRQFDRVVKYYERGFDTRPMAKFYLDMIDECIDAGCLFDSDESNENFNQFSEEFLIARAKIADWYEEHKED